MEGSYVDSTTGSTDPIPYFELQYDTSATAETTKSKKKKSKKRGGIDKIKIDERDIEDNTTGDYVCLDSEMTTDVSLSVCVYPTDEAFTGTIDTQLEKLKLEVNNGDEEFY